MVMQKDESGFGFTLSKEMPVFVENVAGGSSAARAGVQAGDRITKVGGASQPGCSALLSNWSGSHVHKYMHVYTFVCGRRLLSATENVYM